MLASTCLCDHAAFAHPAREQNLSERVINLVRTGVQKILAL
jgi:hypothetical protein